MRSKLRKTAPPDPALRDRLFEQLMVLETLRMQSYLRSEARLFFWQTNAGAEVDLLSRNTAARLGRSRSRHPSASLGLTSPDCALSMTIIPRCRSRSSATRCLALPNRSLPLGELHRHAGPLARKLGPAVEGQSVSQADH